MRGAKTYAVLFFGEPLFHKVSPVLPRAVVLADTGILDVGLVFREHELPPTTHGHLQSQGAECDGYYRGASGNTAVGTRRRRSRKNKQSHWQCLTW